MRLGLGFSVLLLLTGCSLRPPVSPLAPPTLPEVAYVAPCDPKAVAGLTKDAVDALRQRDTLLRRHIERLERQLRDM